MENSKKYGLRPTHGKTKTRVWKIWSSMHGRTRIDGRVKDVKQYAARGISVCESWKKFENFYADMGDPPDGMSLDRIKVDEGYCLENCRWATSKQQMNNRTNTRYLIVDGVKRPLMELAAEMGIKKSAAQYFFSTFRILLEKFDSIEIDEAKNEHMG